MTAPEMALVPSAQPISALLDAQTVQSIADEVWPSLVGDGEVFIPVPAPPPLEPVSAWVTISGPWNGAVVLTCDSETAEALTESVLMLRPPTLVEEEDVEDALGELANVLGGNIKSVLPGPSSLGLPQTGVAPPTGRLDDVCRINGQWRGQSLTITVQGAPVAPDTERNEVPQQ
ncbi:chemotaxis protein CheX [Modestobacter sp. SYSU DS0290]